MNIDAKYRLPDGTVAYLKLNSRSQIIKDKGLDPGGDVQQFHTANVLRRIVRYMPYRSGMTIKVMVVQTDIRKPKIVLNTPYAKYLYYGKKMVDAKTGRGPFPTESGPRYHRGAVLIPTATPLKYTTTKNPKAGPYWDRRLSAAEGPKMAAELQRFINRKARKA